MTSADSLRRAREWLEGTPSIRSQFSLRATHSLADLLDAMLSDERERCAKVAEMALFSPDGNLPDGEIGVMASLAMGLIAAAIRAGKGGE